MHLTPEEIDNLRRGVGHFRAGDYFAAHDAWEEVWQGLRGRPRMFWQAMIQLAVGAYHLENGNRQGCNSLWSKALVKCDALATMYEADLPEPLGLLTDLLQSCLASLQQDEEPWSHLTTFATTVVSEAWLTLR